MTYIPEALRRLVAEQADGRCEYCRLHEDDAFFTHEVDHIYAEKLIDTGVIEPLSAHGRVTVRLLHINRLDLVADRLDEHRQRLRAPSLSHS